MSAGLGAECLGLRVSPTLPSSVPVHVSRQGAPLDDRGNRPPGSSARFGSLNTHGQYLGNSVAAILSYRCQLAFVVGGPRRVDILSRGSQRWRNAIALSSCSSVGAHMIWPVLVRPLAFQAGSAEGPDKPLQVPPRYAPVILSSWASIAQFRPGPASLPPSVVLPGS